MWIYMHKFVHTQHICTLITHDADRVKCCPCYWNVTGLLCNVSSSLMFTWGLKHLSQFEQYCAYNKTHNAYYYNIIFTAITSNYPNTLLEVTFFFLKVTWQYSVDLFLVCCVINFSSPHPIMSLFYLLSHFPYGQKELCCFPHTCIIGRCLLSTHISSSLRNGWTLFECMYRQHLHLSPDWMLLLVCWLLDECVVSLP